MAKLKPNISECKPTFNKLIKDYKFTTVIDIGCGMGTYSDMFEASGKKVTPIDAIDNYNHSNIILGNYQNIDLQKHDCIWAAHVLEHQPNPNLFLEKVHGDLNDNGVFAVTVPPLKHQIVGGHVTLWNAGLLLYQLVLAGFDCSQAAVKSYDYNISVIVKKSSIKLPKLNFGWGDINKLKDFLPPFAKDGFNGQIQQYNW